MEHTRPRVCYINACEGAGAPLNGAYLPSDALMYDLICKTIIPSFHYCIASAGLSGRPVSGKYEPFKR